MSQINPPPTYAEPVIADEITGRSTFNPIWLKWFLDITAYVSASGGAGGGVVHNNTTSKQGGAGSEFYHLTAAQWAIASKLSASIIPYVDATGTVDAIIATYSPSITALVDGMVIGFGPTGLNTVINPTINVNGLGAKTIVKQNGGALVAGDIAGILAQPLLIYNNSTDSFNLVNPASAPSLNGNTFASPGPIGGTVPSTIKGTTINATIWMQTGGWTVATLPAGVTGARTYVTNALAPVWGTAVAGGGAVIVPVFYNGATWIVG